ncbi:OmpA family protein [Zhouia spongiae]|uniref:OmpA family protein n=1 Tax=Zhouia spongiae TaxID=2202721 RepID=A0ABY3YR54_9FLAO|nr:OmpA family protein [Zhouia spongiae]UNY99981.1 OmpA family protein [Zhouia spongiae]
MLKKVFVGVAFIALATSCVSSKVYNDLEDRYAKLKQERNKLAEEAQELEKIKNKLENGVKVLQEAYDEAVAERDQLRQDYKTTKSQLDKLQESYNALEKQSSSAIAANSQKNRELLSQLEEKERMLAEEQSRLEKIKSELENRSQRVNELEGLIAAKDAAMKQLKDAISRALLDFEGKGLTVEQRDGKVYVSMENKLLFQSGSWAVGAEGQRAVRQLASVLAQNPDIAILIEGHTDNVPYRSRGTIEDNWDLSTKRATAIVRLLLNNPGIDPNSLAAAGRGEYAPVATNTSVEGKAKNRRIEVVLTPKLDEVTRLLNDM